MALQRLHISERDDHYLSNDRADDELDLWRVALAIWSARWLVVGGTLAAVFAATVITLLIPKTYEATATIFVTPPTFSSQLKSPALSVEAYAQLAESDYIVDLVRNEVLQKTQSDEYGDLRIALYASRVPQQPYLPLIGLVVEATTPKQTQEIANIWARRFVEEQAKIAASSTAISVNFIVDEFPKASRALHDVETELQALQARHAGELSAARTQAGVELKRVVADGQAKNVVSLEERLAQTRFELQSAKQRLAQLEPELSRTPQYVVLSKAITDDALWQRIAQANGGAIPPEIVGQRLESQEINPVYLEVSQQVAVERVKFNSLVPLEKELIQQIAAAASMADQTRADLFASELKIANLERQQKLEQSALERRIEEVRARFKPLSERIGEAEIARAQTDPDLRLGALAPLPSIPVRPNLLVNVAVAAAVGLLLSLLGAWVVYHLVASEKRSEPRLANVEAKFEPLA